MKLNIAKKWVAALRSGKYKGTKGTLVRYLDNAGREVGNRYCCLGVLCEIYTKENPKSNVYWKGDDSLPDEIRKWAGMLSDTGQYGDRDSENLAYQNDKSKRGFKGIADIIERNISNL